MPDFLLRKSTGELEVVTGTEPFSVTPADGVGDYTVHRLDNGAPITVTLVDVTAPVLSGATDSASGSSGGSGSVSTTEGNGTLYAVVTTSATAPTAAQVALGQDNSGTAAAWAGSQAVAASGAQTLSPAPSGLTATTAYTTHFMHQDAAGNQSAVVSASGFTTSGGLDTPSVTMGANAISWFDANTATMYQDAAKTIPATTAADPVYAVVDQAGGADLTTDDNTRRGVLQNDGTNNYIDRPILNKAITGTNAMYAVVTVQMDTPAADGIYALVSLNDNATWWQGDFMALEHNTYLGWLQARVSDGAEVYISNSTNVTTRGVMVIECIWNAATNVEITENGVTTTDPVGSATPTAAELPPNHLDIGIPREGGYTVGTVAAARVYALAVTDRVPTALERTDLRAWAAAAGGVTL